MSKALLGVTLIGTILTINSIPVSAAMPSDAVKEADLLLSSIVAEQQENLAYSDNGDSVQIFSGYDLAKATEVYVVNNTLGCGVDQGTFSNYLKDVRPMYMIPYHNSTGEGFIYLQQDAQEKMKWIRGVNDSKLAFDMTDIEEKISCFENVEELWLVQDWMNSLNVVFVVADDEEYVIPYSYGAINVLGEDTEPELYFAADFFSIEHALSNAEPGKGGGLSHDTAVHLTPAFQNSQSINEGTTPLENKTPISLKILVIGLPIIACMAISGLIFYVKKKRLLK